MIRTLQRLTLAGALVALVAVPARAQSANVTGKWEFTTASQNGRPARTTTFTFKQDGAKVTGTGEFAFRRRNGGQGDQQRPPLEIKDGKIDGNKLTFSIELSFGGGGQGFTLDYAATVDGDTMKGTQSTPRGEVDFTAKRVKE